MKTFKQFCVDVDIHENWFQSSSNKSIPSKSISQSKPVLAYKTIKGVPQQGYGSGKNWKPGTWNKKENERYGYKPIQVSSYSKKDTPGPKTASGHKFDDNQRLVAVPYKYKEGQVPTGAWKGTPSIPFGTSLQLTTAPMGNKTRNVRTSVQDTGNFGHGSDKNINSKTSLDLSLRTAKDLDPKIQTSLDWGKRYIYKQTPNRYRAGSTPTHQGPILK